MATVSQSVSDYNVVEHLYFTVPTTGYYGIRVLFDTPTFGSQTSEEYGLAWQAVPEPASMALLLIGTAGMVFRPKKRG